ncbi:MAG: DUF1848 family protein, partial [Myxococcota bacterium]|nr:DUF1848 family protein [Myxococcota bacterium]
MTPPVDVRIPAASRRVVSASRRTDLPAYHTPWLMERLRAGWCEVRNPFGGQRSRVDLRPESVLALVLWTRDPSPLLPHLVELDDRGYRYYAQLTLNDYPAFLEPGSAPAAAVIDAARQLVDRGGPAACVWRYDPVILTDATPPDYHRDRVTTLSRALHGLTDTCVVSWVDLYRKTTRNLTPALAAEGVSLLPGDPARDHRLVADLAGIVGAAGMRLELCCEPELLADHARAARCVDDRRLARLLGRAVKLGSRPSRAG